MTLREGEGRLQEYWMTLSEERRFLICGGMYEAEKAVLEFLAPKHYSNGDRLEFVFFHMHGMTVEECISRVPNSIP